MFFYNASNMISIHNIISAWLINKFMLIPVYSKQAQTTTIRH
ncbi:hypothetical protein YPPY46_1720 [Yersinia pestis PY-46]|uniref:Uncharacterized protein n=2 Tax=Yersinia pestis TaxID=632 RepID=A0AAV3B4I6_YERPE|nr:hypothetical protein YpAngola_A2974 [Yersinia pestis Angola]EDR30575.1 hypothetical protein YPIP275_0789 [Yersinia pestis biovar Orientalis str. IP275]EDR40766.1 hypothetical protein YpF1991016_0204 [Yersinia pestis biovar Orientalis str. F1991016]EDR41448.1 hypothetical protein YpE1979001_3233 [Yersinia pestis biovar Antiqua str. E1979001]EDR51703.1 hypothetical protein YpB42003004_2500 [Yersinia pestis biovar Antiqua str. B42003004]EDR58588.1 hypothetical protein YpMG051020_0448 [Yersinia